MTENPRVIIQRSNESSEWPPSISHRLNYLNQVAMNNGFSIICAVGLNHESRNLSVQFSASSSENPHMIEMVDEIIQLFTLLAKRLKQ